MRTSGSSHTTETVVAGEVDRRLRMCACIIGPIQLCPFSLCGCFYRLALYVAYCVWCTVQPLDPQETCRRCLLTHPLSQHRYGL